MSSFDPCKYLIAGRRTALQAEDEIGATPLSASSKCQAIRQLHAKYATTLDIKSLFQADPNRGKSYR